MRYGYHMGYGFYGPYILLILCLAIIVAVVFVLKKNSREISPFSIRLLNILKEKYAVGTISADEFARRKTVVEDIKFSNPFTPVLLERYARCEITSEEYYKIREVLENNASNSLNTAQLAMGNISIEDYKNINNMES